MSEQATITSDHRSLDDATSGAAYQPPNNDARLARIDTSYTGMLRIMQTICTLLVAGAVFAAGYGVGHHNTGHHATTPPFGGPGGNSQVNTARGGGPNMPPPNAGTNLSNDQAPNADGPTGPGAGDGPGSNAQGAPGAPGSNAKGAPGAPAGSTPNAAAGNGATPGAPGAGQPGSGAPRGAGHPVAAGRN